MASEEPLSGWFHPPLKSQAIGARLMRQGRSLRVEPLDVDELLGTADVTAVVVSPRVGSIQRRLIFPDGSTFVTNDNDAVDRIMLEVGDRYSGLLHRMERFHPRLIVFAIVVFALMAGLYRYGIPALANLAVAFTPPSISQLVGRNALVALDRTVFAPSKTAAAIQQELTTGFEDMAGRADLRGAIPNLKFRGGGVIGPNALALPDGTVVVTDELITLSKSRDQIYGVLAHEIAHIKEQHALQRLYRAAGFAALIMFVAGDVGSLTEDILLQGGAMVSLSYSRGQEAEADARGVDLMRAAGRNPRALADFLVAIDTACGGCADGGWWTTHPGLRERVDAIRERAAALEH